MITITIDIFLLILYYYYTISRKRCQEKSEEVDKESELRYNIIVVLPIKGYFNVYSEL